MIPTEHVNQGSRILPHSDQAHVIRVGKGAYGFETVDQIGVIADLALFSSEMILSSLYIEETRDTAWLILKPALVELGQDSGNSVIIRQASFDRGVPKRIGRHIDNNVRGRTLHQCWRATSSGETKVGSGRRPCTHATCIINSHERNELRVIRRQQVLVESDRCNNSGMAIMARVSGLVHVTRLIFVGTPRELAESDRNSIGHIEFDKEWDTADQVTAFCS